MRTEAELAMSNLFNVISSRFKKKTMGCVITTHHTQPTYVDEYQRTKTIIWDDSFEKENAVPTYYCCYINIIIRFRLFSVPSRMLFQTQSE